MMSGGQPHAINLPNHELKKSQGLIRVTWFTGLTKYPGSQCTSVPGNQVPSGSVN